MESEESAVVANNEVTNATERRTNQMWRLVQVELSNNVADDAAMPIIEQMEKDTEEEECVEMKLSLHYRTLFRPPLAQTRARRAAAARNPFATSSKRPRAAPKSATPPPPLSPQKRIGDPPKEVNGVGLEDEEQDEASGKLTCHFSFV